MKNIPYSLAAFVEIAERQSHRGVDDLALMPEVMEAITDLKKRRKSYLTQVQLNKTNAHRLEAIRETYITDREALRKKRDESLERYLENVRKRFEDTIEKNPSEFKYGLTKAKTKAGRDIYSLPMNLDVVYPARQAGLVVNRGARGHQLGRSSVVRALKEALNKRYKHAIYRLDISKFYESIPHGQILEMIDRLSNIDSITKLLVKNLLFEYESATGSEVGLPQGVGLSSHIAEAYLAEFDQEMRTFPGVLFYARYVDDIIIVTETSDILETVKHVIGNKLDGLGLTINPSKTIDIVSDDNGNYPKNTGIEYLGYRFVRAAGTLNTSLTDRRLSRKTQRIDIAFEQWLNSKPNRSSPNFGVEGLLAERIRYLASNTRLINSKSNVAVGIYFSNSALEDDAKDLDILDETLADRLAKYESRMSPTLKAKLGKISFRDGFKYRTFIRYRRRKLERIVNCWKGLQ